MNTIKTKTCGANVGRGKAAIFNKCGSDAKTDIMNLSKDTLQVTRIPVSGEFSDAQLEDCFQDFGPLKRCFVVRKRLNSDLLTIGYVQFAIENDAEQCLDDTGGKVKVNVGEEERELGLRWAHQRGAVKEAEDEAAEGGAEEHKKVIKQARHDHDMAKAKKARLIVRNLPFKAEEADLKKHFEKCGEVKEVKILLRPDGRRVGCGFVQFAIVSNAAKAIKKLNRSQMMGRTVAVDWAVAKDKFQEGQKPEAPSDDDESEGEEKEDDDDEEEDDDGDDDDGGGEDGEKEEHSEDDEEDDDGDSDDDDDDMGERTFGQIVPHNLKTGHDVAENKTVFIRNLSFESDQEDLGDMMNENFGPVLFARMVMDKMTERPRGTAFVKFREAEGAEKAIAASEGKDGVWLDNRQIYVIQALSKENADTEAQKRKEKVAKDTRNLHLGIEGLVRPGTKAAEGVSKVDMEKRVKVNKWKSQMLKDLNMFISPTRLCFRNVPLEFNDGQLKKLLSKNIDKSAKITEAKIIYESKGSGKSKGYAFVSFGKHEDALACLRKMNNNPTVFGKENRPIIEFSVENKKAVNAREKRLEMSKAKNPLFKGGKKEAAAETKQGKKNNKDGLVKKAGMDELEDKDEFVGSLNNPKQKSMPTHSGPKVRHNPRPISRKDIKKQDKERRNPKLKRKRVEQQAGMAQNGGEQDAKKSKKAKKKPSKAATKDFREEKKFTELVEKYKSKLTSATSVATKQKWFDAS